MLELISNGPEFSYGFKQDVEELIDWPEPVSLDEVRDLLRRHGMRTAAKVVKKKVGWRRYEEERLAWIEPKYESANATINNSSAWKMKINSYDPNDKRRFGVVLMPNIYFSSNGIVYVEQSESNWGVRAAELLNLWKKECEVVLNDEPWIPDEEFRQTFNVFMGYVKGVSYLSEKCFSASEARSIHDSLVVMQKSLSTVIPVILPCGMEETETGSSVGCHENQDNFNKNGAVHELAAQS